MGNTVNQHAAARLRQPGAIVLISCYELGHQPIGVAQPLGFLEQAGYRPLGLDISVEALNETALGHASFVGMSVPMHTALRLGLRVAELIRTINPSAHICFYGLYASLNADFLLEAAADSVIGGEYEVPLVGLLEALQRREWDAQSAGALPALEGVSVRGRRVKPVLHRPPADFPKPSRAGLPVLDRYAKLEHDGLSRLVGYEEASRGCLHTCLHCPIVPVYQGRFFVFPERVVLEDIRAQVDAGATHVTFGDPDFLNGPGHSLNIVRAMHREFPGLTFDFTTKIEHILKHRACFPELARSGCLFVISAVESFSDHVLSRLRKGHTQADIFTALEVVANAGITLRPSLVAFTPWTTLDNYLKMLESVEEADLIDATDPVQFSIRLLIPPGSALLTESGPAPGRMLDFLGELDQPAFQYRWTHPDSRMDDLHRAVSKLVEEAAGSGEDPRATFQQICVLAYEIAGRPLPGKKEVPVIDHHRRKPPRLTEPWFCCAEPTEGQFRLLHTKGHGEV